MCVDRGGGRYDIVRGRQTVSSSLVRGPGVVRSEMVPGEDTVIGNAAPVQLERGPQAGRILLPHTRNNSDTWITWSDDDGASWAPARCDRCRKP